MDDTYESALYRDGRDLLEAARGGQLEPAWHREVEVRQVIEALKRRRSVLLLGPEGVGKSAVLREVARVLAERDTHGLVQISTAAFLAGTRYLGEWQTKLAALARAAAVDEVVLAIPDVWHLPRAGVTFQSTGNVLDALRPFVESGQVPLIGEATPEHRRAMEKVPGFVDLFHVVRVEPLDEAAVDDVVKQAAERHRLPLASATRQALVGLSSRFLWRRPQPAPAMGLLHRVVDYHRQKVEIGEREPVDPAFVEKVLSIYTGLPRFVVSSQVTRRAAELRAWFAERIVGQEDAIEAVVETIALFKAGLHDPSRPIGTLLFVGPTGVGKTEVARALATLLFGSAHRLLRFDLSEFKDYHAFEMLLGSATRPGQPARLVDPVRAQPFQVVLFDELDKAHPNVWDLLLPLLDEGRLTTPGGDTIDFRSTILIATSNAGSEQPEGALGFGPVDARLVERRRDSLERHFRPEFLNRFQHVVFFRHLSESEVRRIARVELARILARKGITGRNLVVDVDDASLDLVIDRGFDRRYGARALKREVQRQVVLPVALHLMEHEVHPGQILKVSGESGRIRVRLVETPESRDARKEREPVKIEGKRVTQHDLSLALPVLLDRLEAIADGVDEPFLRQERERLLELRADHAFWEHEEHAARALRDLDRATVSLDRLGRLRQRLDELTAEVEAIETRQEVERAGHRLASLDDALRSAWRELVCMGAEGAWDALVEVAPLPSNGARARDLLVETYTAWARHRHMAVDWLRVPIDANQPALLAIKGHYAHGFLRLEAGLHRVREHEAFSVARVRVAPWTDRVVPVAFGAHRALKGKGAYGQKVRSRVECAGGLVLQNARTLAENRDLAMELVGSWTDAQPPVDAVVRRYDLDEPLVRDVFTGESSGRPDALAPERFHALLVRRVEEAHESTPETA